VTSQGEPAPTESGSADGDSSQPSMLAAILLRERIDLPTERIEAELKARFPDLASIDVQGTVATVDLRDATLFLASMPAALPWSDLERSASDSLLWRNASEEVRRHQAFLLGSLSFNSLTPVKQAVALTKGVAAALVACDEAMGVFWRGAKLLVPKKLFVEMATEVLPQGPPIEIWIDIRCGLDTTSTSNGYTRGMEALGHMEIEAVGAPEKPSDLCSRIRSLVAHLLQKGPVIRNGNTFGQDATERIRIVYSASNFGNARRVMRLDYDEWQPRQPWWKLW
jgi:hypothetical protein